MFQEEDPGDGDEEEAMIPIPASEMCRSSKTEWQEEFEVEEALCCKR